jgi:hypothetical protein
MRSAIVALVGVLMLAGCLVANDPTPSVLDCGVEDQQIETNPNREGRLCLLTAFQEGRAARFESRLTSIEGDPIVRRYLEEMRDEEVFVEDSCQVISSSQAG